MATNQEKLDRTHYVTDRYLDVKLSDLAGKFLDAPITDKATGKQTTPRRKFEYLFHEQRKVDRVLENQAALNAKLDVILELIAPTEETKEQP